MPLLTGTTRSAICPTARMAACGGVRGRIKFGFGTDAFPGATPIEDYFAGVPQSGSLLLGDPTRHIHSWGIAGKAGTSISSTRSPPT
jgi:hypothetical protein